MWPAAAPAAFARMLAGGWLQDCITLLWVLPTRMRGAQASSRACERRPRGVRRHPALPLGCLPALCASSGRAGGVEDRRARLERDVAKHVRAGVQAKRHLGRHGGARRALAAAARGCVAVAECLDGVARHVDLVVLERVPAHPAAARRRVSAAAARARALLKARRARRPPLVVRPALRRILRARPWRRHCSRLRQGQRAERAAHQMLDVDVCEAAMRQSGVL